MSHLLRSHAPITEVGWKEIDDEARERLEPALAARKLVDFGAQEGWEYSAANLGRILALDHGPVDGVDGAQRRVLPAVELRAHFSLARAELRDADRGADDIDLEALADAARRIAIAENVAVFHGWEAGGVEGITEVTPHDPIPLAGEWNACPGHVARAVEALQRAGVGGPYGLALSDDSYTGVVETTEHGGYLLFDHLRHIVGGPLVRAPGLRGGVVVSLRGGDFAFESGQDLSVGYESHDREAVELYIEESFTFRVVTPEAAVALPPVD
jgi:uncharacterized linocin/CFP29 family protein